LGFEYRKPKPLPRVHQRKCRPLSSHPTNALMRELPLADEPSTSPDAVQSEYQTKARNFGWVKGGSNPAVLSTAGPWFA